MWKCATCGENLEQQFDTCWNCGAQRPESIKNPEKSPHDEKPTTRKRQTKDKKTKCCPFCGEEILAVAIKCKHCGSNLPGTQESIINGRSNADYGLFLLAIPVAATVLAWLWIGNMNLLEMPSTKLTGLGALTIITTAIIAAMESSKVGVLSDREKGLYSPTAWFFIITLLWIVGYPAYLFGRRHYGLTNRLGSGLLIMLIFVGSFLVLGSAIEAKKSEIRGNFEQLQRDLNSFGR